MKILITGSKGQLGNALQQTLQHHQLYLTDLPELDLQSFEATYTHIHQIRPDIVIHCAAKTQVDDCELHPDEAYYANAIATKNVVNACQSVDAALVYISTDYVFDGSADRPYREYDRPNPQSVYGKTKLQGEEIVQTHLQRFYIVRTAWLFGDTGHNFVRTMLNLAKEKEVLDVVNDQTGSPTYAGDLAKAIEVLIQTGAYGIYHITNEGYCTWFEFTREILKQAGIQNVRVEPITTDQLKRPAPRPKNSILAKDGLKNIGIDMPVYQEALSRFLVKNIK